MRLHCGLHRDHIAHRESFLVTSVLEAREQTLRRKMHKNRPQLLVAGPLILHDNTRPHEPYSPDMSPSDFDLFPKLKEPMRRRRFSSLEELYTDGTRAIRHMNKSGVLDASKTLGLSH